MENFQRRGFSDALQFISRNIAYYKVADDKFVETLARDSTAVFFSRSFFQSRRWCAMPLWEGDLRALAFENGVRIEFMDEIRALSLRNNCQYMQYATIDKMKEWWYPDFSNFAIANREIDLFTESLNQFFGIREPGPMPPYHGNNIFWPEDERFAIYTDGDNLAFMVGDQREIEEILGVSYSYCLARFMEVNLAYMTDRGLLRAFVNFCDEHIQLPE